MLYHATCIAIDGKGILLRGQSGVGKSDLALRLIDSGADLVSDDQTLLRCEEGKIIASAPPSIAGLFEIRHLGLVSLPFLREATIEICIDLQQTSEGIERFPEPKTIFLLDQSVRSLTLGAREASTPAKIRAALFAAPMTEKE